MGEKMGIKRINGYKTALTASAAAAATSITVGDASRLALAAGEFYLMTLYKNTAFEIVKVTAVAGNTLTIERAQEGSTAQAWAAGTELVCAPTADGYESNGGGGSVAETWYTATNNTLNIANGSKQKRTLAANATLAFTLNDGDDLTLILNPSTFAVTWPTIAWFGSAPSLTASKEHAIVISKDGSLLRGWWQVAV